MYGNMSAVLGILRLQPLQPRAAVWGGVLQMGAQSCGVAASCTLASSWCGLTAVVSANSSQRSVGVTRWQWFCQRILS
jgi:hypothetical protein